MAEHEQVETDGIGVISEGERLYRARVLIEAAAACDPRDAEYVMTRILEEYRAGPPMPLSDSADDDAAFWASVASYEELLTYFVQCGRRLVRQNMGVRGRVQLARRVLDGLSDREIEAALCSIRKTAD